MNNNTTTTTPLLKQSQRFFIDDIQELAMVGREIPGTRWSIPSADPGVPVQRLFQDDFNINNSFINNRVEQQPPFAIAGPVQDKKKKKKSATQ